MNTILPDKERIPDIKAIQPGDVILALPSSGVHSNGFSLVRKVFGETIDFTAPVAELGGKTVGDALIEPTKIYVKPLLALFNAGLVKSAAHITGGGFYENIPRSLPKGIGAKIEEKALKILPIFDLIAKTGNIPQRDMFNTYNMGVGMSVVVSRENADRALSILKENGENAYLIGETVASDNGVEIC